MLIAESDADRFWAKVSKDGPIQRHCPEVGPCWEWASAKTTEGYGSFWLEGRSHKAHRISWLLAVGPFDPTLKVLHKCDNPACVNPSHLWLGTDADNNRDMQAKGRGVFRTGDQHGSHTRPEAWLRGSEHHSAKLVETDIPEVRRRHRDGESLRSIGDRFGVNKCTISDAVRGRTWQHVKDYST